MSKVTVKKIVPVSILYDVRMEKDGKEFTVHVDRLNPNINRTTRPEWYVVYGDGAEQIGASFVDCVEPEIENLIKEEITKSSGEEIFKCTSQD